MADDVVPYFQNDVGSAEIEIGVTRFMCCGASAPYDHPHVFLDLSNETEIVCPYCSTLFKYSKSLKPDETVPAGCIYEISAA